jgi:subtilisin family serine protease
MGPAALRERLTTLDATALLDFIVRNRAKLSAALVALIAQAAAAKKVAQSQLPPTQVPSAPSPSAAPNPSTDRPTGELASAGGGSDVPSSKASGGNEGNGSGSAGDDVRKFDPADMHRAIIAIPLADAMAAVEAGAHPPTCVMCKVDKRLPMGPDAVEFPVIIDLNTGFDGGTLRARERVHDLIVRAILSAPVRRKFAEKGTWEPLEVASSVQPRALTDALPEFLRNKSARYVFANLYSYEIRELARLDLGAAHIAERPSAIARSSVRTLDSGRRAIYRIWPSHGVSPTITNSACTIKADAAAATFRSSGRGIVWAVMDSGIDGQHVHFQRNENLVNLPAGVDHCDFTGPNAKDPLLDELGHGTHVAGIIAGQYYDRNPDGSGAPPASTVTWVRDDSGSRIALLGNLSAASGMAPFCKLVSYKVLKGRDPVDVRNVIAALEHIGEVNNFGRGDLKIHGVNLSLGYPFDPRWFACGESPLCEVVNRLVRYGICVVAAAGNTGHVYAQPTDVVGNWQQGAMMTINDPGNAELAITVGSTHRDRPHQYGPSYFSSKGPTGDGRNKPDVLAPGEKIVSCASSGWANDPANGLAQGGHRPDYREDSGTSMAAPHVSGAIAAFLSVQKEFIGRAEVVKQIFLDTATDLKRERYLQGRGVIDLLRALQSV